MLKITFDVKPEWDLDRVAQEAQKAWLAHFMERNISQTKLAARVGVSYRRLRYFMAQASCTLDDLSNLHDEANTTPFRELLHTAVYDDTITTGPCQFCNSTEDVHSHHVVNRYDSPVMVELCAKCHRKFHFLNKLYRPPQRKTPSRKETIRKVT